MNSAQRRKDRRKFKYTVKLASISFKERELIMEWLETNRIRDWRSPAFDSWKFANEQDAVFFKLTWAGLR